MKKMFFAPLAVFALMLVLPLQALAIDLNMRNETESEAKVCLWYEVEGVRVVEGWYTLVPDQIVTVDLKHADGDNVYVHVAFKDSSLEQFREEDTPTLEDFVIGEDFKNSGDFAEDSGAVLVIFQRVMDKIEDGNLWINLSPYPG